mgnify:CR=1 FL=1
MKRIFAEYSDEKLVEAVRAGKPQSDYAFAELYGRYSGVIHTYCRYMTNDREQAEDVFQETFIKFYNSINKDYVACNVGGFLFRIARNLSINLQRDKKQTIPVEEDTIVQEPYLQYHNEEMAGLVKTAIDLLDEKYREAFVLREIECLSYDEMAEILEITVSGAKTRVSRAKEKIIELLEPYLKEIS